MDSQAPRKRIRPLPVRAGAGWSPSSVSFPTCCSALPESALSTGIALVLGRHQRNNKYCLISVWWMTSFNETGPNCSGKLPYFCVLNGSDPSAARILCLCSLLDAPALPIFLSELCFCSSDFLVLVVFRVWWWGGNLIPSTLPSSHQSLLLYRVSGGIAL